MHPIICKIGPFTVYSYGLTLAVAFLVAASLAKKFAKKAGFQPQVMFNFCFSVLIAGIIGSRLFYVIENSSYYFYNPKEIFMLQHGGLSWFGGLFLAIIAAIIFIKKHDLAFYKTLDYISPFVALAQAIGRLGCFLNGCCFGKTKIPIQICSSAILLAIFVILRLMQKRGHKAGEIFYSYLILYSLKRFFVEFYRLDNPVVSLGLTLFQIIAIFIFIFAAISYARIHYSRRA